MKLPNPQKLIEQLNFFLKQKPKTSLSIMSLLLALSMTILFGFAHNNQKSALSFIGDIKENSLESVSGNQNFSISNILKAREMKDDLEELRANGLKTKADTMKMLKIINQFNEIDPNLKKEFQQKIKEEEQKHQN